ncbi:DUF2949 domain-containing protein [Aerosakkonemataceae cyanobacterium BLCC-F50]|uniref:DUF2949 domain-containing protein n=1 Tax=Floridaenema flaviceps BLCC-F50 TaxID=3153642 RepID=A0ABV4XST3_9CYAN
MLSKQQTQLIYFLQNELAIPSAAISLALRYYQKEPAPLPMILWQYGLVSVWELEKIFIWLENAIEQVS